MADNRYAGRIGPSPTGGYLTEQPASRTRFYRDKRNGKVMGVCAGIADYTGFDVSLVRICLIAAVFLSGGSILPVLFHRRLDRARPSRASSMIATARRRAILAGRARIAGAHARATSARACKDIDRRLADIESYVTTENRSLAREIEQLR